MLRILMVISFVRTLISFTAVTHADCHVFISHLTTPKNTLIGSSTRHVTSGHDRTGQVMLFLQIVNCSSSVLVKLILWLWGLNILHFGLFVDAARQDQEFAVLALYT